MRRIIEAYEAVSVPRFARDDGDYRVSAHHLSQQAFWSAIRFSIVGTRNAAAARPMVSHVVELRLRSGADDGSIHIIVAVWSDVEEDSTSGLLFRLLPVEYSWRALEAAELAELSAGRDAGGGSYSIARIVRRLEMIDLPRVMLPSAKNAAASAPVEQLREIPSNPFVTEAQLMMGRYCVPVLGEFQQADGDWRSVCEELQLAAPATLSVSIHPLDQMSLEMDRLVGSHLSSFVDLVSGQLETAGFAQLGSARRSCDRYLMNAAHLGELRLRVAAPDPRHCIATAHALVARLGGMRAFEIKYPTKSFTDLSKLADPDLDFPSGESDWEATLGRLDQQLVIAKVKPIESEQIRRHLVRMPHLYTEAELEQLLRMPASSDEGLPGIRTHLVQPFYPSSLRHDPVMVAGQYSPAPLDRIRIGRVSTSASKSNTAGADGQTNWHTIARNDLAKHALVVGSTGSGKTVTTFFLMRELRRVGVPFLVIEPVKTEYYDQLSRCFGPDEVYRLRFEDPKGLGIRDRSFFAFDPMRLQRGISVARHVSYLKSCFEAAFPMEPWMGLLFENALVSYYTDTVENGGCGLGLFQRGSRAVHRQGTFVHGRIAGTAGAVYPSFATFENYVIEYFLERELPKSKAVSNNDMLEQTRQIFKRRFTNLTHGVLGKAFEKADVAFRQKNEWYNPIVFQGLLTRNTVLELDGVPDADQKALIMAFLMTFVFEARQAEDQERRENGTQGAVELKHVLVIEEAHRLLANSSAGSARSRDVAGQDSRAKAVSLFADMLAEIRAYGQGITIVEQIPTKIIPEAVKNTNLKIMLRMTSQDDRDYLGAAMNFNEEQKRFVTSLRANAGQTVQFVVFDEGVDQPVLLTLPLSRSVDGKLFEQYFSHAQLPRAGQTGGIRAAESGG